ncbi:MAG: hypothetical protein AAF420_12305 [Pseudomonadota bacterium]
MVFRTSDARAVSSPLALSVASANNAGGLIRSVSKASTDCCFSKPLTLFVSASIDFEESGEGLAPVGNTVWSAVVAGIGPVVPVKTDGGSGALLVGNAMPPLSNEAEVGKVSCARIGGFAKTGGESA